MLDPVRIRAMRPGDEVQAEDLWTGMSPYRPGDEAEVEAMYERAKRARDAGDKRWKAMGTSAPDEVVQGASASWVAVVPAEGGEERVVGTVQVIGPTPLAEMPPGLPLNGEWRLRDDVAELKRLRVADDVRRQGVGHTADTGGYRVVPRARVPYPRSQHDDAAEAGDCAVQEAGVPRRGADVPG